MNTRINPILNTDSYKTSHFLQYPPKTEYISSYIEARGGDYPFTLFYGLQILLKSGLFKIIPDDVPEAKDVFASHGVPFNEEGWKYILGEYDGNFPLHIQAVKEGTIVSTKNVLVQVNNTDPKVPWLTSYIETPLLRGVWYPTTVATRSYFIKKIMKKYLEKSGADVEVCIPFMLHDFGFRGVSSFESAGIGGSAHLVNFMGTDTLAALKYAKEYYGEQNAAFSIPAAEHSTITTWGENGELKAFENMLDKFGGPGKIVAVVSDSFDIYNAVRNYWGEALRDKVMNMGGRLVIRPDSGDPTVVPVELIEILGEKFGYEFNRSGYKVLPPCVRVIQGDGVNEKSIEQCLKNLTNKRWSAENIVFGMGGEMLQTMNRDTQRWAMKANAIKFEGDKDWTPVFKRPVTDPSKASKSGRLALTGSSGLGSYTYRTVPEIDANGHNLLEDVWFNGKLLRDQTFTEVRELSNRYY